MGIKYLIVILASLGFTTSAFAEDDMSGGEKKPFSIYGDFAGSIHFNSGDVRNDASSDELGVDLAEINVEKNWSKSKLHLSLGFGNTASAVNPVTNGAAVTNMVNVMNAYYAMKTSYGLGFMFGKFESPVGHEHYTQMENSNYNRSYGFRLAPYFQTGLGLDYGQDMWKAAFIVSNGNGFETDRNDNNKTMALVVDLDPMENLHVDLNYVTGNQATGATAPIAVNTVSVLDISVAYDINEMINVALNYIDNGSKPTTGTTLKANSIAAYVNANFGMFGLGVRYEAFKYDNGALAFSGYGVAAAPAVATTDNKINAITITAKAEIDQNAVALLEYQMDKSDQKIWFDKDGVAKDTQNILTAAVMYRF